jgi:hypothetical protein
VVGFGGERGRGKGPSSGRASVKCHQKSTILFLASKGGKSRDDEL